MSVFDFGKQVATDSELEAWHPRLQEFLPKGNYVIRITEIENVLSSGGYPMLKIRLESDAGYQFDNLVISPNEFSVSKLLGLIDSAKIPRPDPEKGEIDKESGKLSDAYVNKLIGREVGVIVRDEEDNREDHVGEYRPRVQGYVDPAILTAATTGPLGGSTASPPPRQPAGAGNGGSSSKLAF